jgi:2-aminoethylphosphonate-pyruvate transaminase
MKRNILLNPGPATTSLSVKNALVVADICPREKEFGLLMESIHRDLVKVVHGGDDYTSILFTASGTGAVESAIASAVPKGKQLLVIDNGAYGTRMANIAVTYNIDKIVYKLPYGTFPDIEAIELIIRQNDNISHLAMVHHETTTGMLNPVKEISAIAHRYNIEMIVDAISSYAGMPINICEYNIEYLISTSNKCIQGMPGLSFVIAKKTALQKLSPNLRLFYLDLLTQYNNFEYSLQSQFTPAVQVAYALRRSLDEYFEETESGRAQRYRTNWQLLYDGMTKTGFRPLLPLHYESKILTAFCEPDDESYNFDEMHDYLIERGFTIYPGKGARINTFRLSILGDLYPKDIADFLDVLTAYISEKEIRFIY